jgi:hypothetical protein
MRSFQGFDFDDTSTGTPDHGDNFDREDPKKRPKWWHNTIGDVQTDEMIKGHHRETRARNLIWSTFL